MSTEPLPPAIESAVTAVGAATRRLMLAGTQGDADGIERSIEARGAALAVLERELAHPELRLAPQAWRSIVERLALEASDADAALRRCVEDCRLSFEGLRRAAASLRGYATISAQAEALDRAG